MTAGFLTSLHKNGFFLCSRMYYLSIAYLSKPTLRTTIHPSKRLHFSKKTGHKFADLKIISIFAPAIKQQMMIQ